MSRISVTLALLLLLGGCSAGADLAAAKQEAEHVHSLLNSGQFAAIYEASAPQMKQATQSASFVKLLGAIHRKLGAAGGDKVQGTNVNFTTNGEFITLIYNTQFAAGPATENFVFLMDGGAAKLVGYHINSDALILN